MSDFTALAKEISGQAITPTDPGYEEARKTWNATIDKHPKAIVRCQGRTDVEATVKFAAGEGLNVSTRSGGHNVSGGAVAGDVVIDLSEMRSVKVDPDRRVATVEGGALLGDIDGETQKSALAVPVGLVSKTGIGGLCLNGGMGWWRNKWGLTCDNVISAEVVLADGTTVTASEDSETDLYWAIRGGGGHFGSVISFDFRCHPVGPDVAFAGVFYPVDAYQKIIKFCLEYSAEAPDDIAPAAFFGHIPAAEAFPEDSHGKLFLGVVGAYPGDPSEGEELLEPLKSLGEPIVDISATMPFVELQQFLDEDYPDGKRYYWKSLNLDKGLEDHVVDILAKRSEQAPSPESVVNILFQGGEMSRIDAGETAFGDRSHPILIGIESNWEDPAADDANVRWARETIDELDRFTQAGAYMNFAGSEDEQHSAARGAYGQNYERLVEIKKHYDPEGVFFSNLSG